MILATIKKKIASLVEYNINREMDREREVIYDLQEAIKQTGIQLTDRIRHLEQVTEELNKRIQDLDRQ